MPRCSVFLNRFICTLVSVSLLHWTVSQAVAQDEGVQSGTLTVTSEPSGLSVYVDEMPIGLTPVTQSPLLVGSHTVRIVHPHREDWDTRDWTQEIVVVAGDTVTAYAKFVGTVTVLSTPFDADVYVDGIHAGSSPIHLPGLSPGVHTVSIRAWGYQDEARSVIVSDTTRQVVKVDLAPTNQEIRSAMGRSRSSKDQRLEKILGYATLGLGVVFSGLALHSSRQADRAYDRYLGTADPVRLEQYFQQVERYDTRTSRLVVVAQVNFTAAFYFFLSRVFRSDSKNADRNHK